ncbi:hypothetical protein [Fibrobacter succinogenes]|uniref:hypothetical protein n=1 Tax=Fibrobacter succinogenes TaxID=833 RepID=UPI001566664E|nr:hypothetical protein [Fibrobacter succinogenes]
MKGKFIHRLSATIVITIGILIGCSDNVSDVPNASSEISSDQTNSSALESSGSEVSSSEISGPAPSSSANPNSGSGPSSSAAALSSQAEKPTSSATDPSSSAKNPSSSAGASSAGNSANSSSSGPIARSSSSYSKLLDEPQDERHKIYRLLYPVENGKLDTGFFDQGSCDIKTDGSFTCNQKSCIEYVGGYISFHSEAMFPNNEHYSKYFQGSTDETRLIDINLGDSALTSYIPYADIPEFDINDVKSKLSTLPAATCTTLVQFVSNYKMSASGLPEGFVLHLDANFNFETRERVTEPYSMIFPKEELDTVKANIGENEKRIEHGYKLFDEKFYIKQSSYYSKSSIEYNTYVTDQGCGIVSQSYIPMPTGAAGLCQGWHIPELAQTFSVRFINTSDKTPASFTWKLTYMDQFGRGGTIDITTQLK